MSVIVPTRGRPHLLTHALESVAGQEFERVEVIVVNDGGPDVSQVVHAFHERLRVRLVTLPVNRGLASARNVGIEVAQAPYIAFLDDDDIYLPNHLQTAVGELEGGAADLVYTICLVSSRRVDPKRGMVDAAHAFNFSYDYDALAVTNYIPVNGVVCRSPRAIGARFDVTQPVQEDWVMWLNLTRVHGFRFRHLPAATTVYHRIPHEVSMTTAAGRDAACLQKFGDNYRRVIAAWPALADSRIALYRRYVLAMYQLAAARLDEGSRLGHFYYEKALRVIHGAFTGTMEESRLIDRLREAISEEHP